MTLFQGAFRNNNVSRSAPSSDYSEFKMTEQIESGAQVVRLVGNMRPKIPFKYGGSVNAIKTYYAGQKHPTVQVTHTEEADLLINGTLKDRRQSSEGLSYLTMQALEQLRLRGNMLKLELGEWVRYGYLSNTEFEERDKRHIDYRLGFTILGETKPEQCPILQNTRTLPFDANAKLKLLNSQLAANLIEYPDGFPQGPFDIVSGAIATVAEGIALVTGAVDSLIGVVEDTQNQLNRALSLATSVKSSVFRANQRIGRIQNEVTVRIASIPESLNYSGIRNAYPSLPRQTVTSGYRNVAAMAQTRRVVAQSLDEVINIENDLKRLLNAIPKARHLVRDGESLQTIAVIHYGNAEEWIKIKRANSSVLVTTDVTAGMVLEIPR